MVNTYQFPDSLNLVRIQPRGRKYSFIELKKPDGEFDWKKVYRLMSSKQMVEDIEAVRRHLFAQRPTAKIYLYGRSGGGYLVEEYLARYSHFVNRAFIRNAPHPKIMKELGNPESRSFYQGLDAYDKGLHGRLKTILARETVPKLHLLYMLMRMTYAYPNPTAHQAQVINELYKGKRNSYDSYLEEKGLNFSNVRSGGAVEKEVGPGRYLRPLECDWDYLMGPEADYVDPLYTYLRHLSAPLIATVEKNSFPPPTYPTMEELSKVESEVFYLAAVRDAVSPYQIGIELGAHIPNFELFIADDNHTLVEHPDCYPPLRNAFFEHGIGSDELKEARQAPECKEWVSP
jgi:pimeloyl-ACP methyl ester carboxylesterase